MSFLSISESNLINSILNNPEEDFHKIVSLIEKKIKQSVDKYKSIYENTIEGVCIVDHLGDITFINQRMTEILGYSNEETIGKSIFSLIDQEEAKNFKNRLESRKRGISEKYEVKLSNKNGEEIYVKIKATPQYDENGNYDGSVAFIEDVTEKRINEQLLRESEEKFRTLIEGLTQTEIGVDIIDLNHNVIYQNDFLKSRFGEHKGRKCYEHFLGRKNYCKNCPMEKAINTNRVEQLKIPTPDNRIYEITSAPLPSKEGKVDRAAEVIIDVTERVQIEQKLKESEEKFRTMAEQSLAAIGIFQNNEIQYINKAYEEFTGYTQDEIYSMTVNELIDAVMTPKEGERLKKISNYTQSGERRTPLLVEMQLINKNREKKWFLGHAKSISYQGKPAALHVLIDITERRQAEADLKREALFTEEALNAQRDTFFVFDPSSGKAIRWNKAFREISGYSDGEILAMRAPDSYYDEKNLQRAAEATRLIEEKSASYVKMDLITKDGNSIPFEYIGSSITDEEGNLKYIVSVGRDITDRKKAEQIIKESEFNLKKAQEMAHIGHWKLNPVTEEVSGSDELFNIFGLTREEASLNAFAEIVHPDDREYDLYHIQRGIEKGIPWDIEHRLICKDGTEKWIHAIGNPIRNENGKVTSILGTIQDVTEPKNAELKLKESEEKFRTITEDSHLAISIMQDDVVKYTNQKMADLTGYSIKEILSWKPKEYAKVIAPDSLEQVIEQATKKQRGDPDVLVHYPIHVKKKSGELVWTDNISTTIMYEGQLADLVTQIDITELKKAEQELKESEEKFRTITEQSFMGIIILQDGLFKYFNQRAADINGYSEEEIQNWKPHEFAKLIHPEDRDFVMEQARKKQGGEIDVINRYNYRMIKKSGEIAWLDNYSKTVNYMGRPADLVMTEDITDKIIAEQQLKVSEEFFRTITEQSLMGIAIIQDSVVKYASKRLADIYGYSVEEMLNFEPDGFLKLIDSESLEIVKEQATKKQLGQKGTITHYEVRCVKKTGEKFWVENYSKTINYNGKPADFVTNIDITERKKTEQLLKESEENYRNLIETSSMGLLEIDNVSKNLKYINPRLLEILEYNEEELLKFDKFDRLIHPEDLKETLDFSQERKLEFRIFSKSGKVKWMSGDRLHYYDEKGDLIYVRFWLQDITEKKELEQIKVNLLIRFSHEFKTPLISIKGFSDLILEEYRDNVNEKIVSFLEKIKEGAITLNSLTNRFIESSQLDENLVRLNIKRVNIAKLINRVLIELEGVTKSRKHKIDLRIEKDLLITCDPEKIHIAISNLMLNASKFTPQGGLITVSTTIENGFVIISIKDNGIGFNKEELERLFKPFGKIERYGQGLDIIPDGMGMGLYITKELVELHKGMIWAESAGRNKGSIFNVKIPINQQNSL